MDAVITEASISLDGYIANQDNTIGRLFDWVQDGDLEIQSPAGDMAVHLTPESAEHWRRWTSQLGAVVVACVSLVVACVFGVALFGLRTRRAPCRGFGTDRRPSPWMGAGVRSDGLRRARTPA